MFGRWYRVPGSGSGLIGQETARHVVRFRMQKNGGHQMLRKPCSKISVIVVKIKYYIYIYTSWYCILWFLLAAGDNRGGNSKWSCERTDRTSNKLQKRDTQVKRTWLLGHNTFDPHSHPVPSPRSSSYPDSILPVNNDNKCSKWGSGVQKVILVYCECLDRFFQFLFTFKLTYAWDIDRVEKWLQTFQNNQPQSDRVGPACPTPSSGV